MAGALWLCPALPDATKPPQLKPDRRLSPTTVMRRNRGEAASAGADKATATKPSMTAEAILVRLARFSIT